MDARWEEAFGIARCGLCGEVRPKDETGWKRNVVLGHPMASAKLATICPDCWKKARFHLVRQKIKGFLKGQKPKIQAPTYPDAGEIREN